MNSEIEMIDGRSVTSILRYHENPAGNFVSRLVDKVALDLDPTATPLLSGRRACRLAAATNPARSAHGMRLLFINTDYPDFLTSLYSQYPGLHARPYAVQAQARADSLFGLADFYSRHLRERGHEAWDIDVNNEFMQKAWAGEFSPGVHDGHRWKVRLRRGLVPWLFRTKRDWFYEVLRAQVAFYKPDVLFTHTLDLDPRFLREIKPKVRLLVGSHASPLVGPTDLSMYDLMISCVDNFVDYFRQQGVKSERLRFGFEPAILTRFTPSERSIPVSFIGNVFPGHASRHRWLAHVCESLSVGVWSPSLRGLGENSPIARRHRGPAWGVDMYGVLQRSRVTLNHHIDVAQDYAGNVRLFESTGMGALLVTDWKKNLHEMFEPGKEVVAYRTDEECVEMIQYYLEHDAEREAIARAGQQRTLRDHTFSVRMEELEGIVLKYL